MTDTSNLGTIWVVGQRRAPGGNFPPASGAGGGGPGEDGGIHQDEVDQWRETRLIPTPNFASACTTRRRTETWMQSVRK